MLLVITHLAIGWVWTFSAFVHALGTLRSSILVGAWVEFGRNWLWILILLKYVIGIVCGLAVDLIVATEARLTFRATRSWRGYLGPTKLLGCRQCTAHRYLEGLAIWLANQFLNFFWCWEGLLFFRSVYLLKLSTAPKLAIILWSEASTSNSLLLQTVFYLSCFGT